MLTEKIIEIAKKGGCESKALEAKEIIFCLSKSTTTNIAVLGETNSGKATLVNKLAGKEVRAATRFPRGEPPLRVIFDPAAEDHDYEVVKVSNDANSGLTFNEIPINAAIDYDTKQPTLMLEKMDAVIYVVSAIMPMTASDVENITALKDKFPIMLYISKTDIQKDENDTAETTEYVRSTAAEIFGGGEVSIFSSADASTEPVLRLLRSMETDMIRKIHIGRIVENLKQAAVDALNDKLKALKDERASRAKAFSASVDADRDKRLRRERLRLEVLEHGQETIVKLDKKMNTIQDAAKQDIIERFQKAKNKREWLRADLKKLLQEKLKDSAAAVCSYAANMASEHGERFSDTVKKLYGKHIAVEYPQFGYQVSDFGIPEFKETPDKHYIYLSLGSGIIAAAAIANYIMQLPAVIEATQLSVFVSMPPALNITLAAAAALLTVVFTACGIADRRKYKKHAVRFIEKICDDGCSKLTDGIHHLVNDFYEKIVSSMNSFDLHEKTEADFSDIDNEENGIRQLLGQMTGTGKAWRISEQRKDVELC